MFQKACAAALFGQHLSSSIELWRGDVSGAGQVNGGDGRGSEEHPRKGDECR
ncbi:MAG: hypothetical protein JNN32_12005 [Flavobacteriales bacterium]|nr:hypothetical protein [Flavobacteriales bacterium]